MPVKTHGHSTTNVGMTPIYSRWRGMKDRCYNPNSKQFHRYGGRGISVCARWRYSFETFLSDMGEPPEGLSLDRINNDGNYEPGNCRWATSAVQRNNQGSPGCYSQGAMDLLCEKARAEGYAAGYRARTEEIKTWLTTD